jgi:hypothetical protein
MARIVYKKYYRCDTQLTLISGSFGPEINLVSLYSTFNGVRNVDGTYSAPPAWFTQYGTLPLSIVWEMTPPAENNTTYNFSWTFESAGSVETEYIVSLTMIDYCNVPIGCDTNTPISPLSALIFLSREGGWPRFIFNGKKSFEVTIPEGNQYINTDYVTYNTSRRGVFNGETLTSGNITKLGLDLLQSLKTSIQVYYVENIFGDEYSIHGHVRVLVREAQV